MNRAGVTAKWIKGVTAGTPAAEAAKVILRERLKAVDKLLRAASRGWSGGMRGDTPIPKPEVIHALRVATRRAGAALRLLQPCIGEEPYKQQRRQLKRIRRAAAAARQCDVHVAALRCDAVQAADEGVRAVLEECERWTREQAEAARDEIRDVAKRWTRADLRATRRAVLASLAQPDLRGAAEGPATFKTLAGRELPGMFEKLETASRGNLHDPVALHALRIRCKDVRYALEVFRPCVEDGFDELYADVEHLQEELGYINDAAEMLDRIERFRDARCEMMEFPDALWGDRIESALRMYERKRDRLVQSFFDQWTQGRWRRIVDAAPTRSAERCAASGRGHAGACKGQEEIVVTPAAPHAAKGSVSMRAAG